MMLNGKFTETYSQYYVRARPYVLLNNTSDDAIKHKKHFQQEKTKQINSLTASLNPTVYILLHINTTIL